MWAQDFLAEHSSDREIINDSWTPSGPMHIGSFRSMVIHDVLRRVLDEEKKQVLYLYGYDDYDPMDGIPPGFSGFEEHLGKPLVNVPARSKGFKSFAEEFIAENLENHEILGVKSEHYRTSELYKSGKFNHAITKVLDQAGKIRQIYQEVSGSKRPNDWFPFQVICPNCGKLGSTYVSAWDGKEVTFECRQDLVPWAKGCGYKGKVSPYDGAGKMHWRVEWAAKWDLFGVTIEAAGKDHANKGGSFDTGERILKEVFGKPPIAAFGHEFFLLDGKKMGSTKGMVTPADALGVFPAEILRFLIVRNRPSQAIEIDLQKIVPPTYDEYDRCQGAYLEKTNQDQADYFYLAQIDPGKVDGLVKERFSTVASLLQLPGLHTDKERPEVRARLPFAKTWLEKYAPPESKFLVSEKLPPEAKSLSEKQKEFLRTVAQEWGPKDGEEAQTWLYQLSQELDLRGPEAFQAIYLSFIGKPSGPKAGMLLTSLDPKFVKDRLLQASK